MPQAADPTAAFTLSHTVGAFKFRRWDCTNSGQRKRSRAPVRSRHVPLSRPQPPQTAAKVRGFSPTAPGFTAETDLYGAFPVKGLFPRWLGSRSADCSLGFAHSSLFGAGKAVLRPVACDQVPGARGRGQGTETLAQLGGLPP